MDIQQKIKEYETLIKKAQEEKIRAETQLQNLKEASDQLREELKKLNITEEQLPGEITRLDAEIAKEISMLDNWALEIKGVLG